MSRVKVTRWILIALLLLLTTAGTLLLERMPLTAGETPATRAVYDNALAPGWQDWSWRTGVDFDQNDVVHDGNRAIAVTHETAWAGLYLHSDNPLDLTGVDALRFWVHGGSVGSRRLQVALADAADELQPGVPLTVPAGYWQQVELSLAELGAPEAIGGVAFQDATGQSQPTYYLDQVAFVNSATAAPPTPPAAPDEPGGSAPAGPALVVDATTGRGVISPYIYGVNVHDAGYPAELNSPLRRWGGNATSRYNWQLDVSNRAADWYFENVPAGDGDPDRLPAGSAADRFVAENRRHGADSILTVPLLGWTPRSRDLTCGFSVAKYGPQQKTDPYRPDCGNGVRPDGSYIAGNDPADTSVPVDPSFVRAWVEHLTAAFGPAGSGGVRFYNLDNEPMLWHESHRDVRPEPLGYDELRDRTFAYAEAVKAADPGARLLGPTLWGWTAYFYSGIDVAAGNWDKPPDYAAHGGTPFVAWYLQQMAHYEQTHGRRLLDYLDLHYYPQSEGISLAPAGDAETQARRLRSTRSLWDPTYTDESWIAEPVQLIPQMRHWVDTHYPGTRLAITEYNWGGHEHINGALAQADVLGIFGREGLDLATLWAPPEPTEPASYAFRIYRNYDGAGSAFGDIRLSASSHDQDRLAVYAARRSGDDAVTVVVINKSDGDLRSPLAVQGTPAGAEAEVYRYSEANLAAIVRAADRPVGASGFTAVFPARSITLFVIPGADVARSPP